ncbi:MAG: hypothetical protein ACXU9P_10770, partial [Thermodesulfobacteriota bacterium]
HRERDPDLSGGEALFYQGVQEFNARSRMIKVVLPLRGRRTHVPDLREAVFKTAALNHSAIPP